MESEPIPEYENTRIIQLQDLDLDDDQLDALEVYVYGKDIENIGLGEIVQVSGDFYVQQRTRGGRLFTILHTQKVEYEKRETIAISDKDIEGFKRFAKLPNVIEHLVLMTAPNIVGSYNDKKLGVLRSLVGGTDPRKGRIHTLFAGNPGTAKTAFMTETANILPKSKFVSCTHASGKAITAMIEKANDGQYIFRLGVVPKATGSIAVLDEMQLLSFEDQDAIRGVMQEGRFNLNKFAREKQIIAETTILGTCNPIGAGLHGEILVI